MVNKLQNISIFMIFLLLSLPIVVAQELSVTRFSGRDGVDGFIRKNDELTVEALVKVTGATEDDPRQRVRVYSTEDMF